MAAGVGAGGTLPEAANAGTRMVVRIGAVHAVAAPTARRPSSLLREMGSSSKTSARSFSVFVAVPSGSRQVQTSNLLSL